MKIRQTRFTVGYPSSDSARPSLMAALCPTSRWNVVETQNVKEWKTEDGKRMVKDYCVLPDVIEEGLFGPVLTCTRKETSSSSSSSRKYALKQMNKWKLKKTKVYKKTIDGEGMAAHTELQQVYNEIEIIRTLLHPNIVTVFEILENEDRIWFVMEYMQHGPILIYNEELKTFENPRNDAPVHGQQPVTEAQAKMYFKQLLSAVSYLHDLGIVHRDIKPSNFLLDSNAVGHLSDFGCVLCFSSENKTHGLVSDAVGTYPFLSPECCAGIEYSAYAADWWAVGITLYTLLFGRLPFSALTPLAIFEAIQNEPLVLPENHTFSPSCIDLLTNLLHKDPDLRLHRRQLENHAWLNE